MNRFIGVLFGIFLTSLIFSITIRVFETTGIYLGAIFTFILTIAGLRFTKPRTLLRLITWSMLGTLIACTLLFIVVLTMASTMLDEVAL